MKAKKELSSEELYFTDNIKEAACILGKIDLLHSSGAIQCVENPYDYLKQIISVNPKNILFNRLGLTRGNHDVITVHESWLRHHAPGKLPEGIQDCKVSYPLTFPMESNFMNTLTEKYNVEMEFEDSSGISPVNDEPIFGLGLFLKRRL